MLKADSKEFDLEADDNELLWNLFLQFCLKVEPQVEVPGPNSPVNIDIDRIKTYAAAADADEAGLLMRIVDVLTDRYRNSSIDFNTFKAAANSIQRSKGQRIQWAGRLGLETGLTRHLPVGSLSDPLSEIRRMDDAQITEVCRRFAENDLQRIVKKSLLAMQRVKATVEATNQKFVDSGGGAARYATLDDFHAGPERLLGLPNPRFMEGMEMEHCRRGSADRLLVAPNYRLCTKSVWEWFWAVDVEATGRDSLAPHSREFPKDLKERLQGPNGKYPGEIGDVALELKAGIAIKANGPNCQTLEPRSFEEKFKKLLSEQLIRSEEEKARWLSLVSTASVKRCSKDSDIEAEVVLPIPNSQELREKLRKISGLAAGVDSSQVSIEMDERFYIYSKFLEPQHLSAQLEAITVPELEQLELDFEAEMRGMKSQISLDNMVQLEESGRNLLNTLAQLKSAQSTGKSAADLGTEREHVVAAFQRQTSAWKECHVMRLRGRCRVKDLKKFFKFESLDAEKKNQILLANLRMEELLALFLYTGPLYVLYNAALRGFPTEMVRLLDHGLSDYVHASDGQYVHGNR